MAAFIVSYDLRNYEPLWARLREWKAVRALESLWIISTQANAARIRDDLGGTSDANDGLLVTGLTGETAWQKIAPGSENHLRNLFAMA